MSQRPSPTQTAYPIGVVIPTYNRAEVLLQCLGCLELQTWTNFEVLIVDDGSTDDTRSQVEGFAARTSLTLRYVRQENSGPARVRNHAVSLLRSDICLLIGDDILASPGLVERHLALHRARPELAVVGLGQTRWSEEGQRVTPFMRWLDTSGIQFSYGDLQSGVAPGWRHFYTSNLSLKTEQLRAHPFREEFRKAAMEDIELGYRMSVQNALEVVYLPDALAYHLHPTSVSQACRRMIAVGAAGYVFGALWPEHRPPAVSNHPMLRRVRDRLASSDWALARLRGAADLLTRIWCPNPLLQRVMELHLSRGYRDAEKASPAAS